MDIFISARRFRVLPVQPNRFGQKSSGVTVHDNGVTWAEAGTILGSAEGGIENLVALLPDVNGTNARYGAGYVVAEKHFIRFDAGDQESTSGITENDILKVTIRSAGTAETLTELFTIR